MLATELTTYLQDTQRDTTVSTGLVCLDRLVNLMELLQVSVNEFVAKAIRVGTWIDKLSRDNIWDDHEHRKQLTWQLEELRALCTKCELPMTQIVVDHILACFNSFDNPKDIREKQLMVDSLNNELLMVYLSKLRERLSDELSTKLFFQVPYSERHHLKSLERNGKW